MKRALMPLFLASIAIFPAALFPQQKLTATNLPDFLARYDTNFGPLEGVFNDLKNENLPLTDETGQPLARRPLADRLIAITNLRQTARQFAAKPDDLVLATTVVIRTEILADDLFDLSQVAYDNDREDLGNRLSTLQTTMEENKELLADYLLALAAEKQSRLQQLEKEVEELQQKLKEVTKPAASRARGAVESRLLTVDRQTNVGEA
jgi:DNA polymerase III delta prime subunit